MRLVQNIIHCQAEQAEPAPTVEIVLLHVLIVIYSKPIVQSIAEGLVDEYESRLFQRVAPHSRVVQADWVLEWICPPASAMPTQ
jgi:hypothetical protein